MACHLKYFEENGYFNSMGYVNNMGINLVESTILGIDLTGSDKQTLENAILQSDADSQDGNLPGIVNLIQLVENMQDKYGVAHDHKHAIEEIVKTMCSSDVLIRYYGLEHLAQKLASGQKYTRIQNNTHNKKKTK